MAAQDDRLEVRLRQLVALAEELDLVELTVGSGEHAIHFRRGVAAPLAATRQAVPAPEVAAGEAIRAPLTGTFHRAPAPGQPPFVTLGQAVAVGDVLGIIESMKMINPIEAQRAGTVAALVAVDGAAVTTGDTLLVLD